MKFGPGGGPLWTSLTQGPQFWRVIEGSGGSLFVTGRGILGDLLLCKAGPGGDTLWTRVYNGGPSIFDIGNDLAETPDGGIAIAGAYATTDTSSKLLLMKTNSVGDSLWAYLDFNLSARDAKSIIAMGNSSFRLVGVGSRPATLSDGWVLDLRSICPGPLPAPSDVVVQLIGNDMRISWQPVIGTDSSCTYGVRAYLVYFSVLGGGPYYFLNYVYGAGSTSYLHDNVVPFSPSMFYNVTAYNGPPLLLEQLPRVDSTLTQTEVECILSP